MTNSDQDLDKLLEEANLEALKINWIKRLRVRAKSIKVPFNLRTFDINLPKVCPVLGIPLQFNTVAADDNSYAMDRLDNTRGYTRDNVNVMSYRANRLKSDATLEECVKLGEWAAKQLRNRS